MDGWIVDGCVGIYRQLRTYVHTYLLTLATLPNFYHLLTWRYNVG